MSKKIFNQIELRDGEKILFFIRSYSLIYWWRFSLAAIFILLPFFLLYLLLQWPTWGLIIFSVLLIFGLFLGYKFFIQWYFTCFAVTSERVIDFDQKGVFSETVSQAELNQIEDVYFRKKGAFAAIFNYGNLILSVYPGEKKIRLRGVRQPAIFQEQIIGLTRVKEQAPIVDTAEQLKNLLKRMRRELGEEIFDQILAEADTEFEKEK